MGAGRAREHLLDGDRPTGFDDGAVVRDLHPRRLRVRTEVEARPPDHVALASADRAQVRVVHHQYPALDVLGEDEVRGARGDRLEEARSLAQGGGRPLERRRTFDDPSIELRVRLPHRTLRFTASCRIAQDEHRPARLAARIDRRARADLDRAQRAPRNAQRRLAAGDHRLAGLQRALDRELHGSAGALVDHVEQFADLTAGRGALLPAGQPLGGRVHEPYRARAVGRDHPVADAREDDLQRLALRLRLSLRALAALRDPVELARDPEHERAQAGDRQDGEHSLAERFVHDPGALSCELQPVRGERHHDRRRQEPAADHRARALARQYVEQPGVGSPREQIHPEEQQGDRRGKRHAEERRNAVKEQQPEAEPHQRQERDANDPDRDHAMGHFPERRPQRRQRDARSDEQQGHRDRDRNPGRELGAASGQRREPEISDVDIRHMRDQHDGAAHYDEAGSDAGAALGCAALPAHGSEPGGRHQQEQRGRQLQRREIGPERAQGRVVTDPAQDGGQHDAYGEYVGPPSDSQEYPPGGRSPVRRVRLRGARRRQSAGRARGVDLLVVRGVQHAGVTVKLEAEVIPVERRADESGAVASASRLPAGHQCPIHEVARVPARAYRLRLRPR